MKKKLLLVGVAAMGLLAVGVGATSTFAWFTADAAVALQGAKTSGAVDMHVHGQVTGIEVTLGYTIATKAPTATNAPDLSNSTGQTQYISGTLRDASSTTGAQPIGILTFTPDWNGTSLENKAAMLGHVYSVYVKGEGNLKIMVDSPTDASDSYIAKENSSNDGYLVYIKNDNGDLKVSRDNSSYSTSIEIKYAVRTNNPYGLEVAASETTGYQAAGTYDATAAIEKGQAFTDGAGTPKYYVAKDDYAANATSTLTDTSKFDLIELHSADKVDVSGSTQVS